MTIQVLPGTLIADFLKGKDRRLGAKTHTAFTPSPTVYITVAKLVATGTKAGILPCAINKVVIDRAVVEELGFVSLIWHPWSLHRFDPTMEMLDLTFKYIRDLGLTKTTYAGYRDIVAPE